MPWTMPLEGPTEVARAAYLADTSAFARLDKPHVAEAIGPLIAEGKIALCAPVAFELGVSARNGTDHEAIMSRVDGFASVPVTEGDHRRALALQRLLADRGQHRGLSLTDALVAAIAEARSLTVLHYDAELRRRLRPARRRHRPTGPMDCAARQRGLNAGMSSDLPSCPSCDCLHGPGRHLPCRTRRFRR